MHIIKFFESSICEYSNYYWLFIIGNVKQDSFNQKAVIFWGNSPPLAPPGENPGYATGSKGSL